MKKFIYIVILELALLACDNSQNEYDDINLSPVCYFSSELVNDTVCLVDSVKLRDSIYSFNYTIEDEQASELYPYLTDDSNLEDDDTLSIDKTLNIIDLKFTKEGTRTLTFSVQDGFEQTCSCKAKITVFDNLSPVPVFSYYQPDEPISDYEYVFDLSDSYDQDSKYGGSISYYYFQIDDEERIVTTSPTVHNIFQGTGEYIIKYKVCDDDGEWSEQKFKVIEIED